MKKPNAASVYYFIEKSIKSCVNEGQLKICKMLIDNACFYNYAFIADLRNSELIRRCELLIQVYPVYE